MTNANGNTSSEFQGDDSLETRIDNLETKVDHGFERLGGQIEHLGGQIERLGGEIDRLDAKIDSSVERLDAKIDSSVERLDAKIDSSVERLEARADQTDARVDRIEGWVSGMRGQQYEQHCRATIAAAMSRYLRRARIGDAEALAEQLSDAFEGGAIDQRQYHSASMTDIVGQGYCRQRQTHVHLAAETSIRLNRSDIDRVRERADILTTVTGNTHIAYCIAHRQWSGQLESYADARQVTLLHYHWDGLVEISEAAVEEDD